MDNSFGVVGRLSNVEAGTERRIETTTELEMLSIHPLHGLSSLHDKENLGPSQQCSNPMISEAHKAVVKAAAAGISDGTVGAIE